MWLFTKYGFYSIVCQKDDKTKLMVRARRREHLENLQRRFPNALKDCTLLQTTDSDYRYRLFVDKQVWKKLVKHLVQDITYSNFKDEVKSTTDIQDYTAALHRVWGVMYGLQQ